MRRSLATFVWVSLSWMGGATARSEGPTPPPERLEIIYKAGKVDRRDAPARLNLPESVLGSDVIQAIRQGPAALELMETDSSSPKTITAQVESVAQPPGTVRVTWVQPGLTPAGTERRLSLVVGKVAPTPSPWIIDQDRPAGTLDLKRGDLRVFRYIATPQLPAGIAEIQRRDSYIHPIYTPSGKVATGDFSKAHTHHRGLFLAYAKAEFQGHEVDVWNIHDAKKGGKIVHDGLSRISTGPVTASFSAKHLWKLRTGETFLEERWDVEAFDVPGSPYWLFDLASTQTAANGPVELLKYRYGGMAYRGPDPFLKGKLDVLTSEGKGRVDGDQKPARWVDLSGPASDDPGPYLGVMIADHPSNATHPTVARIHPTTLPFFSYVPAHDRPLTLSPGMPRVFRYRILVHDGHPSQELDERVWRDFAEPAEVSVDSPRRN